MSIVSMLTWISPILGTEQMRWRWRGGLTNGLSNILVLQMLLLQVCYGSWITTFLKTSEGTLQLWGKINYWAYKSQMFFWEVFLSSPALVLRCTSYLQSLVASNTAAVYLDFHSGKPCFSWVSGELLTSTHFWSVEERKSARLMLSSALPGSLLIRSHFCCSCTSTFKCYKCSFSLYKPLGLSFDGKALLLMFGCK